MLEGIKRRVVNKSYSLLHQSLEDGMEKFFQNGGMVVNFYFDGDDLYNSLYQLVEDALTPYKFLIEKLEIRTAKLPESGFDKKRNQYNVKSIIESRLKSNSRTSFEVYITKEDIYLPHTNWAYGVTSPPVGMSILSVSRYSKSQTAEKLGLAFSEAETKIMFKDELRHEFGHLVGLTDHREGDHKGCSMDQTLHLIKEIDTEAIVTDDGSKFCDSCESYMESLRAKERRTKTLIDKITKLALIQNFGEDALRYLE